jgi:hypothetical protein
LAINGFPRQNCSDAESRAPLDGKIKGHGRLDIQRKNVSRSRPPPA